MDEKEWELFDNFNDSEDDDEKNDDEIDELGSEEILEITDEENPVCFSCKSKDIRYDSTDNSLVCNTCGIILCTLIDKLAEKNNALIEGSTINFFLPKSSLGTSISGNPRMKIKQVNEWWKWVYKEKSFYEDKQFIEQKCKKAKILQPIIDNALNLYKKISESKHKDGKNKGKYLIVRGVNRIALMGASVFYGAKMQKQPRSPKEIANIFDIKLKYMNRGRKKFLTLIDNNILVNMLENNESCDFVERYCNKLSLDKKCTMKAIEIIKNINRLQIASNHEPPSVAAASILLMADFFKLSISKKDLHEHFKISEVTIAKTYKRVHPFINIVSDTEITCEMIMELQICK